jgi:archaellum component FlaC
MKNKKITSILSSVLLASFALVPVSAVFADDSTSTATTTNEVTATATTTEVTVVATTTTVAPASLTATSSKNFRYGFKGPMDQKKIELKNLLNTKKDKIKDIRGEIKDLRNASGTRPDWKNGSTTASSTIREQQMAKKMQERKDAQIKNNIDNITKNLTTIAGNLGSLGTEIKAIVAGQASSSDAIAQAVAKEDSRGTFAKFMFGADPKNLGTIISQVSIMQARINQLNNQISKLATSTDKTALITNVQTLKDQIATLEQYVKDNINSFSLFGWFVQKFNK